MGKRTLLLAAALLIAWYLKSRSKHVSAKRRVLVTGGGNGIGAATVRYLATKGDFVFVADVDQRAAEAVAGEFGSEFCFPLCFDVRKPDQVQAAAQRARETFGPNCLDCIVNLAGVYVGGPMVEMDEKDIQFIMDINVVGTYNVNKAFFTLLDRKEANQIAPTIINTGSEVSYAGLSPPFATPYSMSKIAIESYSTGLRQELACLSNPVNVTVLNPGAIGTQMLEMQKDPQRNPMRKHAQRDQGTLFKKELENGAKVSEEYVVRNMVSPNRPAEAVYQVVHASNPPRSKKVNVSTEMEAVRLIPQPLLDVINRIMM